MDDRLPASLAAAWGLREPANKGPKRGLSLERIAEAGVRIASTDGLGSVSMSRVAAALGTATMSLYRYVGSKDELLALMIDAACRPLPAERRPDEDWRAALSRWARAFRDVLSRHPWIVRVPVSGPPITPNQVLWFERGLACLHGTRLSEGERVSVLLLLNGFVRNEAILNVDLEAAAQASGATIEAAMGSYGRLLSRLIDNVRFPSLSAVLKAGVFDHADSPDSEFEFGLTRILDGVEALVRGEVNKYGSRKISGRRRRR